MKKFVTTIFVIACLFCLPAAAYASAEQQDSSAVMVAAEPDNTDHGEEEPAGQSKGSENVPYLIGAGVALAGFGGVVVHCKLKNKNN